MAKLFPRLPFVTDETPLSWAGRLAAFHTFGPLLSFLNDLSIRMADLAGGMNGTVERLCEIADQDPAPVLHNSIKRVGNRSLNLRDKVFSAEFLTGPTTQFCPACLVEDERDLGQQNMMRRSRLAWSFRAVRTCPVHHIALVERKLGTWDDFAHQLAQVVPEPAIDLMAMTDAQPQRGPSPLQDYILARLDGQTGPDWLDGQSLDQVVRSAEMLGAVLTFGPDAKAADLSAHAWDQAGRASWPFISQGVQGVRSGLCHIGKASRSGDADLRLRSGDFGMLHSWLSASKLT